MSHGLSLSPFGRLACHEAPELAIAEQTALPNHDAGLAVAAFTESSAAGLIALASQRSIGAWGSD